MPLLNAVSNATSSHPITRILVIGAGSRGNAYARAIRQSGKGIVAAIAEPIPYKRQLFGSKHVWQDSSPEPGQEFSGWQAFLEFEKERRKDAATGKAVPPGIDGMFICVLDEHHAEVVTSLAPLNIHMMCEKPLATTLQACLNIFRSLLPPERDAKQKALFGIGHVLRYSPHNMLLRKLLLEDRAIGDILSVEHTEPVGYWHFSHSYVRGNWRKESTTAPSLLAKSCHDLDFLLWLLCSPAPGSNETAHLPEYLSSSGSLKHFRRSRKPKEASNATNCLQCPIQQTCIYSAPRIYYDKQLAVGNTDWPVNIVNPEIESCYSAKGAGAAKAMLFDSLRENYDSQTTTSEVEQRPWYGRCVWESDNDVVDDQHVTITWEDEEDYPSHNAKTATFHMIAHTEKQCERRGWIYGSEGEISYDGTTITVYSFAKQAFEHHHPPRPGGGHGGGDEGLVVQFLKSIDAVQNEGMTIENAQAAHLGCTLEEIIRSHALVFAAEDARKQRKIVDWRQWWSHQVDGKL